MAGQQLAADAPEDAGLDPSALRLVHAVRKANHDIFEASHTYKLKGRDQYLTLVEAQGDRRRYYKAYLADRLEGPWIGLADSRAKPFAANSNVAQAEQWTTNISHGELLRTGVDEFLEVDASTLRFLFQGASDDEYRGQGYGAIPWRLGLLLASHATTPSNP